MSCLRCYYGVVEEGVFCPECVAATQRYIDGVWEAVSGGVHVDRGSIRNVKRATENLQRHWAKVKEATESILT